MDRFYRILALLNFLGVLAGSITGLKWLIVPLLFTGCLLLVDGITNHTKSSSSGLFLVGAILNYMGILSGVSMALLPAIPGYTPAMSGATLGSILLLTAYWSDRPKNNATPTPSGDQDPE